MSDKWIVIFGNLARGIDGAEGPFDTETEAQEVRRCSASGTRTATSNGCGCRWNRRTRTMRIATELRQHDAGAWDGMRQVRLQRGGHIVVQDQHQIAVQHVVLPPELDPLRRKQEVARVWHNPVVEPIRVGGCQRQPRDVVGAAVCKILRELGVHAERPIVEDAFAMHIGMEDVFGEGGFERDPLAAGTPVEIVTHDPVQIPERRERRAIVLPLGSVPVIRSLAVTSCGASAFRCGFGTWLGNQFQRKLVP